MNNALKAGTAKSYFTRQRQIKNAAKNWRQRKSHVDRNSNHKKGSLLYNASKKIVSKKKSEKRTTEAMIKLIQSRYQLGQLRVDKNNARRIT